MRQNGPKRASQWYPFIPRHTEKNGRGTNGIPPWAPRTGNDGHPIGPQPSHGRGTMGTLKGTRMGTMGTPKGPTEGERWAPPMVPIKERDAIAIILDMIR